MNKTLRKLGCSILLSGTVQMATACPFCNPKIREAIYDSQFYPNLLTVISAFVAIAGLVALLTVFAAKRYRTGVSDVSQPTLTPVPLFTTATILGIGLGGFVDGIVLHQILQWHEMLSAKLPPTNYVNKSVNMFWDGIFHACTLLVTFVGVVLLWRLLHRQNINRSGSLFSGGLLAGWGVFNLVEGLIDHQLFKLHNVKEISPSPESWNVAFLLFSLLLLAAGFLLAKKQFRK
jgi:uncharacterized membrane protein